MLGHHALVFLADGDGLRRLQKAPRPFRELFHIHMKILSSAPALDRPHWHDPARVLPVTWAGTNGVSRQRVPAYKRPVCRRLRWNMDDRLIVALDVPNALAGLELAERIGDAASFYKIGLGMLTGGGLALANELKQEHGKRIFLDMKFFDIGATVEAAVKGIAQYDLDFLTVHGDPHVVRAAKQGASGSGLKILAVTILTSLDRADLDAGLIVPGDVAEIVATRAARAFEAGADGVIASPREAALIRALPEAAGRLIVTPGVRPAGSDAGDQKRIETPATAIASGADHIVVGRPIWQAADPRAAAQAIQAELAGA
ncbi:orotidine-5'-phosphate decarboxylase [Paracoccus pantotrophus]|uniref:Orotidine 5'-phosphate decarboxylase n=2 Tax=Paracoccus pantotrophus TaxID=82367 RepID=A0AAE6TVI2_PARPN|nr:orotidine-5'-phosphate decarboxylase [Paracoccus pantotrophus]RDE01951.1 orotidine-5'-phosphate decarboxylase [Paracoccus pantotrophus]RNI19245.1 orotidine-5'-phosphate decarboxylase [Paracoccus pantotrophus]WGR64193.1 orotidine-5'-phosphate decarboxylase [Paracoccus pantotrophus]